MDAEETYRRQRFSNGTETRPAVMYSLVGGARFNECKSQARLAGLLACIADTPQNWLNDLLPRNWRTARQPGTLAE